MSLVKKIFIRSYQILQIIRPSSYKVQSATTNIYIEFERYSYKFLNFQEIH